MIAEPTSLWGCVFQPYPLAVCVCEQIPEQEGLSKEGSYLTQGSSPWKGVALGLGVGTQEAGHTVFPIYKQKEMDAGGPAHSLIFPVFVHSETLAHGMVC